MPHFIGYGVLPSSVVLPLLLPVGVGTGRKQCYNHDAVTRLILDLDISLAGGSEAHGSIGSKVYSAHIGL